MSQFFSLLEDNRRYFFLTLFAGIAYSAASVAAPNVSGQLVTAVIESPAHCAPVIAAFCAVYACQLVLWTLDANMQYSLIARQKRTMRRRLFSAYLDTGAAGREDIGAFLSFLNNDVPSIAEQYIYGAVDIVKCLLIMLLSAASLFSIHWVLAAGVLLHCALILLWPSLLKRRSGEARRDYSEQLGKYNARLQSLLSGLRVIRSCRCKPFAEKSCGEAHRAVVQCDFRMIRCHMAVQGGMAILQISKSVTILLLGLLLVVRGSVSIGGLFAVIQLADLLSSPIEYLAGLRYARNMAAPLADKYRAMTRKAPEESAAPLEPLESITVEHVSCQAEDLRILRDVSAAFSARKKYLVMGRSGSGKSTLIRLIGRSGELEYGGRILYNGRDIAALSREGYCARVSQVFQEPYLFLATLEENVLLGRSIPRDGYLAVLEKLNLGYLLERCGDQELTPERMDLLSGGERQRIALARAMVGKPEAYLLDEVTSALDPAGAEAVEALLLEEDALVVHICHKPNPDLMDRYDGVYQMENGVLSLVTQ